MSDLVLVTGTSGAGRTTAAAATALAAARAGRRTLLLCAERPGDAETVLGAASHPDLTLHQVRARATVEHELTALRDRFALPIAATGFEPPEPFEVPLPPGATEFATWRALAELDGADGHDLVVVDLPEADRAATWLSAPGAWRHLLDRALPPERLAVPRAHPLLAAFTGLAAPRPGLPGVTGRLGGELARLRDLVAGPDVRLVLVHGPGPVAARAARRGLAALALHGHLPDAVVVNGAAGTGGRPVHPAAHVAVVPALADPPTGPAALADWAAEAGTLTVLAGPRARAEAVVENEGDRFELVLPLPGADRADLDLVRHGDDLVVTVGEHRRVFALASVLRRCTVTGAALRDGHLRVRFTPDPDVWMRTAP